MIIYLKLSSMISTTQQSSIIPMYSLLNLTNPNNKKHQNTNASKHINTRKHQKHKTMFINEEQKATLVEKTQQYFKQVVTLTPDNAYESRIKFHNDISRKEGLRLILTLASKETHKFSKNNWHLGTFGSVWRDIRIGNKIIRAYFVEASNGVFQTICNVYDTIDEENKINDWMPQLVDPIKQGPQKSEENDLNLWVRIMPVADSSKQRHCLLYTSPSPRDRQKSRMPSSA